MVVKNGEWSNADEWSNAVVVKCGRRSKRLLEVRGGSWPETRRPKTASGQMRLVLNGQILLVLNGQRRPAVKAVGSQVRSVVKGG